MSTLVARCSNFAGAYTWPSSAGSSEASTAVCKTVQDVRASFQQPVTGQTFQRLLAELDTVFSECSRENWDGYDALPVRAEAYEEAIRFLELLPPSVPPPEIVPEPDGEIAFEWTTSANKTFIVGVKGENVLTYTGVFSRTERMVGREHFVDVLSQTVTEGLCRLLYE